MGIDQIVVLVIFIAFCVGTAYLVKKASVEIIKEIDIDEDDNIKE